MAKPASFPQTERAAFSQITNPKPSLTSQPKKHIESGHRTEAYGEENGQGRRTLEVIMK